MTGAAARALAALFALAPAAALAGSVTTLGLEHGRDHLDNGTPEWRNTTFSLVHGAGSEVLNLEWRGIERFGERDDQWVVGAHSAIDDTLGLGVEFAAAGDPAIVPEFGMRVDLDARLPGAVVAHLGVRAADYPDDKARTLVAGVEHYRGAVRVAYTLSNARLKSGDSGTAHVVNADWYYGDGSRVGVVGATGDEATRVSPAAVIVTDVRSAAVVGHHWLGAAWGVSYACSWTEQGDFYTRTGGTLGLLYRF